MFLKRTGQTAFRCSVSMVALFAVIMSAGSALAQTPTNAQPAKPKAGAATKGKPSGKRSAINAKKRPRNRRAKTTLTPDPNAKWFCKNTTATIDPVWRGPRGVSFTFDLKNEGTAPLKIKAKGG